ncbi:MAG: hypothetical protein IT385_06665 [Deltaproteobacteria bacterium]|nr:hypothetical protein [Deltaproteobacteria bacterium]
MTRQPPAFTSVVVLALAACGESGTRTVVYEEPPPACHEGTAGCPCEPDNTCDAGLVCTTGWCTPSGCTTGALDCACYPNATCDAHEGTPMTCESGICQLTETPADGTIGGSCASSPCADGLVCDDGRCDDPTCPLGALGCACAAFGACDPLDGRAVPCVDGRCRLPATCDPGTVGCACGEGDACAGGLACQDGLCRASSRLTLVVAPVAAEACDVLLTEPAAFRVSTVAFEAHVQGETLQRSPAVALAFITRAPGSLGRAATIDLTPIAGPAPLARPTITRAVCYDALGRPLADTAVTFD